MSARWSILAIVLAGCDVVAGIDEFPNADLAPGCSGTRLLRSFGDGVLDPIWSAAVDSTSTLVVGSRSSGQLSLTTTMPTRIAVQSVTGFDVRGDAVSVGVTTPGALEEVELDLWAASDSGKVVRMTEGGGTLHFAARDGATGGDIATLAYDPVAHRYWRIEDVAGEVRWETSSDDHSWVVRATAKVDWVDYVTVGLALNGGSTATTTTTFDSIDAPAPDGVVCRATVLVDDFHGDTLSPQWHVTPGYVAPTVSDGQLTVTIVDPAATIGAAESSTIYDLRESAFTVHVVDLPATTSNGTIYMGLRPIPAVNISLTEAGGFLGANLQPTGSIGTLQWDPTLTWWRLRGSHGVLYWEVSADGRQFTSFAQSTDVPLDRIAVSLGLFSTPGSTASFEHFNVAP